MKTQQLQFPRVAGGSWLYLGLRAVLGAYLELGGGEMAGMEWELQGLSSCLQ